MATTFFDLIVVFLFPLLLLAVAWTIFNGATAGRDGISQVVEALTRTNGVEDGGKRGTGFSQSINGERQSDERPKFTR
ncbi:hypothetical protein [Hyphomicrobium sp. 2TAF46]|uniref:hypothetical protein n=1 Tax=Hyphomicrobium sp. 2TAF46 TaxID=3233019 RepID=UPI003F91F0F1